MLARFFRKIICAVTLLRLGALKVFIEQLRRQIYSREVQIGMVKYLDDYVKNPVKCQIKYNIREASEEDMKEAFSKIKTESKESAQMLLNRKWLYECGCRNWYIAKTADTNEMCFMKCVIRQEDIRLLGKGFKDWFPELKEDEILSEGAYVFEKFRGSGLAISVLLDVSEIYRKQGFRRVILYIDKAQSGIGKMEALGFTKFEEVSLYKTLFFSKRKPRPC